MSSHYYQAAPRDDAGLRAAMKELAARWRRLGYRILSVALRRWRKVALWLGENPMEATRRNDRWSLDFMRILDRIKLGPARSERSGVLIPFFPDRTKERSGTLGQ